MGDTPTRDAIWDDLAAIAFELLAKPDDPARDAAPQGNADDAEKEERER